MKKLISVLLALLLLTAMSASAFADSGIGVEAGDTMPDFTVSLCDGTSATLSELLKEKDLVVLNIFATWCGPCEKEFPDMEKVYEANKDRMLILSVSGDPNDTMEMLAEYKASHGLSFPIGQAGDALSFLKIAGFPTTLFIDRQGQVGFIKVGSFLEEGSFAEKVNYFLSPDYNGQILEAEIAKSSTPYVMVAIPILLLLSVIGRWILFRKSGKPGWHSLIPVLSNYQEFDLCWKGWIGLVSSGLLLAYILLPWLSLPMLVSRLFGLAYIILLLPESLKLAKAFDKGTLVGVLLFVTAGLGRIVLGLSKAQYQGKAA